MSELDKNTTEVPSSTIKPIIPSEVKSYDEFTTTTTNYWMNNFPECYNDYIAGLATGKYGKNDLTIDSFFNKIFTLIKELTLLSLAKKQQTSEQIKNQIEILNLTLKMLSSAVKSDNDKDVIKSLCAHMHGFVVSSVKSYKLKE